NIGTYTFSANSTNAVKVWTSIPNGQPDGYATNDTLEKTGLKTGLSGSVTVGGLGADFADLVALSDELNTNGICGPVQVYVNPAAGPYIGRLSLRNISGLSVTDTLRINGQGSVISYEGSDGYANILLDDVHYVTIDSFVINVPSSVTAAFGIQMLKGSHNRI